ncbi:MAG: hypothetical protein LUC90_03545 [Lachnospiraceae bacterium]|nr:hypothetical protein [Lachnospiraceae bacterium]
MSKDERIDILDNEYQLDADNEFGKELNDMCNLSQGIWEQGIERGVGQGELKKAKETAGRLYILGWNEKSIADLLDYNEEQVCLWLREAGIFA